MTNDDVNEAFKTGSVTTEPDKRLLEYLQVLATETYFAEHNQAKAVMRSMMINTILTRRAAASTSRDARIAIYIAVASFVVAIIGLMFI